MVSPIGPSRSPRPPRLSLLPSPGCGFLAVSALSRETADGNTCFEVQRDREDFAC